MSTGKKIMYIVAAAVIGFSAWQLYRFDRGAETTQDKYSQLSASVHQTESESETEQAVILSDVRSGTGIAGETEVRGAQETAESGTNAEQNAAGSGDVSGIQETAESGTNAEQNAAGPGDASDAQVSLNTSILTLQSKNPDAVGWIRVPGTAIDYPVVQTVDDPEYYLHRDFDRNKDIHGTPFLDAGCRMGSQAGTGRPAASTAAEGAVPQGTGGPSGADTAEESGGGTTAEASTGADAGTDNLIIYGHHMKDGTMFADLMNYRSASFYREHPDIELTALTWKADFRIFAVLVLSEEDRKDFPYYRCFDFDNEEEWKSFISGCSRYGIWLSGQLPDYGARLVTLSTCEYSTEDGRLVVIGAQS